MKLTNEITDRCIRYFGDILQANNRKDMRSIITKQNRREREAENESKREQKEEAKALREIEKEIERSYVARH